MNARQCSEPVHAATIPRPYQSPPVSRRNAGRPVSSTESQFAAGFLRKISPWPFAKIES